MEVRPDSQALVVALILRWRRLIRREFVPLIAKVILWGSIGLVLGVVPMAQLLAASFGIAAGYGLFAVATAKPVRLRAGAAADSMRTAKRRAWILECGSGAACLISVFLIGALYTHLDRDEIVPLLLMMGCGLPARCNGPFKADVKRYVPRLLRSCIAVVFVGGVLWLAPSTHNVALALAAREWAALAILAVVSMRATQVAPKDVRSDAPAWTEFFAATSALSMRRFFYQAGRSALHLMLGPFGTMLARTGRGLGWMKYADSFSRARTLAALCAVGGFVASVHTARLPGAAGLAISTLMLRLSCLGAGAILWSLLAPPSATSDSDLEEEDLDGAI